MLIIDNINIFYGKVHAVKNISMKVNKGEIVTLIGANGAGKSSILKAVSNVHTIKNGRIIFNDREIHNVQPHKIVECGISHCPEGRRIFYDLTVKENLMMGGYLLSKKVSIDRIDWVLTIFPKLRDRLNQTGGTLSGGEQQMLAIGRALVNDPKLLLLDEPSLGLAPKIVERIFATIIDLNNAGLTVLLVEQNAYFALEISKRAYVLETGNLYTEGRSSELLKDERIIKAYLGG